jgi:hypothetical protein
MADFLDDKRKEIDARLRELRPLVDEYNRLEKAAAALAGVGGGPATAPRRRRSSNGGRPRRGRPRITITELADAMGIKANYLYRVMPTLQKEGQVKKRDKGWHPA